MAPGRDVPTPVVRLDHPDPGAVAQALRTGDPPIVARVDDGDLWLDLPTVPPEQERMQAACVRAALGF
jgi:L-seryl-tRNA(Ser) seleniumtransferase